jgi:phosphoglucan,water dikinase
MPAPDEGRVPQREEDAEASFRRALVKASAAGKSWRERLGWVRDRLVDPAFAPTPGQLATLAVYLRFLATGELRCAEDGRHFRPNHHAEAALQIETALERLSAPDTAWVVRRIYPYLPSSDEDFRRSEPLTRIRDIAHRNDIPHDLKQEIKRRLQNKLHRCAGPEDLRTSAEILGRITAAGAGYPPAFVREFQLFHAELQEFFNATGLEERLRALAGAGDPATADAVKAFLALKAAGQRSDDELLNLLERLTALRQLLERRLGQEVPHRRSRLRLADIGLEDYAFALLSECVNRLEDLNRPGAWAGFLRAVAAALENLRLSLIEPEECAALHSEVGAWARDFRPDERFHLLRLLATLTRARRLAEGYADRINRLFMPRAEALGRALGVEERAVKVFGEGDIRGHLVFQLSRLLDLGVRAARQALQLLPWEAIVPGEASGTLVGAADLAEVEEAPGPLLLLLEHADGDAEIPAGVRGIALGHPMPLLSHLGVRARQARVPFAACPGPEHLEEFRPLVGKQVRLSVTPDGLSVRETEGGEPAAGSTGTEPAGGPIRIPEVMLAKEARVLPLDRAEPGTGGAKAAGARRLLELAGQSGGLFRAPRGLVLPFGAMERCLDAAPAARAEYLALVERLPHTPAGELDALLGRLRDLVRALPVPEEVGSAVAAFFGPGARLAIRSSANGEDLENLAGAGLYDSVVNVPAPAAADAIRQVWASLWTHRATVSRAQAGIPHDRIRMAVLLQELVAPDLSFILHTVHPLTGNRDEALAELAVGLGEVLASAPVPGVPYRMTCDRRTGAATLTACATFAVALRPADADAGGVRRETLDYSKVPLSADPAASRRLGERLAKVAAFLEERLGRPQDVEGAWTGDEVHVVQARPQQGL